MNKEIVRVLRVIEYVGDREWVEDTLKRGAVPANGEKVVSDINSIKSATIGQYPEVLNRSGVDGREGKEMGAENR
jgi:hypothetical protein